MTEPVQMQPKNTEEILVALFALGKAVKDAKQNDGKIDANDLPLLFAVFPKFIPAVTDLDEVPVELKNMTVESAEHLASVIAKETGSLFSKEEIIIKIEKGLKVAVSLYDFISEF